MSSIQTRISFLIQGLIPGKTSCLYCRSDSTKIIARKYVTIKIRQCPQCLLCFTDPVYRPIIASNLYDEVYTAEGSTTRMPNDVELKKLIDTRFRESDKCFADRLSSIRQAEAGEHLMEIGSSWGYFLHQAKSIGFTVSGIEIGKSRREYAIQNLGLDVRPDMKSYEQNSLDIIYTAHVLEHFTNLNGVFDRIFTCLRPGGVLILEVPNFNSRRLSKRDLSVIGAVHPIGFDPEFFFRNLPISGFKDTQLFDSWDNYPNHPTSECSSGQVIIRAIKPPIDPLRKD